MRASGRQAAWLAVALVWWAALWPAGARAADPPAAAQTNAPAGVSAQQARDLADLLNDPARRAQLIGELRTLEKTAPAAPAPAAASAAPAAPAAPAVAEVAKAVSSTGLLHQLASTVPRWAAGLPGQMVALRRLIAGVPSAYAWLVRMTADADARQALMVAVGQLLLVVVPALLVWLGLSRVLRPQRARLAALAGPAAHGPAVGRPGLQALAWSSMRRISLALPALLLDVLPVAAFAGVGYLLGPVVAAGDTGQTVLLIVIEAGVIFGGALCFARLLVAPNAPGLRLIPMTDASAHAVLRWVGWLAGIAVFGLAPLDIALLLGLDAAAHLALAKLVLLIDHVLLVVVILRNRRAVAAHLRAPKRLDGMLPRVLSGLADVWHIFAIVLVMGMWLIWAVGWQTGYTRLLQFVGLAIAIGVVTRLVIEILLAGLRHLLRVPDKSGGAAAPGGAGARAARYYVLIGMGITFAVRVVGLVVLLQLSGADALGWLFGNTLGRQAISALISVAVTLCVAAAAWEGVNIALDRHLDGLSRRAQIGKETRLRTLLPILRSGLAALLITLAGLTVLSDIGVNIAPLLAGAGIIGVAIGFGSQKLVQDLITGVFLLLENAMQVGDFVTLAGVSGTVEHLSVRTIRLRAGDGSMHIIPFSSVTMVNNTNRGLGNAAVSVSVTADQDPDAVGEALKAVAVEMRGDPAFKADMLSDLELWGVDKVDGVETTIVGQIVCTDTGRWGVQREFNRRYRKRFRELGIDIAMPTQTLLVRRAEAETHDDAGPRNGAGRTAATVKESPPPSSLGHGE